MKIDREALAWAGGFFSGEGYTGLNKFNTKDKKGRDRSHYKRYPSMNISQTGNGEELHRFNKAVGNMGTVRGPYGPYSTTRKSYYQLTITSFGKVQATIAMLWPFLSIVKQAQANNVLKKFLEQPDRAAEILRTHCKREHEYIKKNTYVAPKTGWRQCRKCNNIRNRGG